MSNESGVPLSQPVPVLHKSIQVNFKDFAKALGKAGVDIAFGKWDSLAGDGVDLLAGLGLKAEAGEIAWLLVYRSLMQAMKALVAEKPELEPEKFDYKGLQAGVNAALANSSLTINPEFFVHPGRDAIVSVVQPPYIEWLKGSGFSEADAQALARRLPIYFALAVNDEWGKQPKYYAVLKEKLDTPFTQASERARAWLRYSTWLQKQVEEPVFLEAFSLKQVFVWPRAYYTQKVEGERDERWETPTRQKVQKVVVELKTELESWITKADKNDAIRLISGGPGSGKSSFTKMFATELVERNIIPVLFVPLHHFEPSADLVEAVGKFVKTGQLLPENPLDQTYQEDRLLIIFDGLDELAMQGKIAERTAQEFVQEVQHKVGGFNQQQTCVMALISGRELVIQHNETFFRREKQILHLLPYFVPNDDHNEYVDPERRLEHDQRQDWWRLYGEASGNKYTGLPEELDQGNLIEITSQPLLNYLVALSLKRGELEFSEETNLNAVYADLLKAIYDRGWAGHQHATIEGIEERDFIRVLEEIALASWHGNGRTTTVQEIENHCDNSNLKILLKRFQEGFREDSKASITRLLTAFYFRQSGHTQSGDKTFEFTHKSFGEYLTARRIVKEVEYIQKKLDDRHKNPYEDWNERSALHRWLLTCGPSLMDDYLFRFILDEIRLIYQHSPEIVITWQQTLCHLISMLLQYGMPTERINTISTFQEANRQSVNAEESLLIVLNACARVTQKLSIIDWPSDHAFRGWLLRLQGARSGDKIAPALKYLSFLGLKGSNLILINLFEANLERANLERANLERANLVGAKLVGTNLERANLFVANLEGANLEGANLERANLEGANLERANLEGANLERANLFGANLEGANLEGANLFGANLERANLTGTILDPNNTSAESGEQTSD